MTTRLPFTLTPLPDEPFGLWWHTYALRLGVTRTELAHTVGIPAGRPPGREHTAAIAAATGLPSAEIARLFTTRRPCPPEHVLRVWTPQPASRFCPACLADGSPWQPTWSLPLTVYCLVHTRLLANSCPGCGQPPPSPITPSRTAAHTITSDPSTCQFCGHDLTLDDRHRAASGTKRNTTTSTRTDASTQAFINTLLARLRDRASTAADREQAQDDLTDLTLIALHLTQGEVGKQRRFTGRMPDAAAFGEAVDLLATPDSSARPDRLMSVVAQCLRGPRSHAVPFSWRAASPALKARIARGRDTTLTPIERVRYATTLPTAGPQPRRATDPAPSRAARLPDQLWPVWAIRLTDDEHIDGPVFRSAMIAALLLPHSELQLANVGALLPHQPTPTRVAHQLHRLAAIPNGTAALRILTELGLALDHHTIPIDYPRRRRLVAHTELIDRPTWIRLCHDAGLHIGRARRLDLARRYLYELLTGGNLATAPQPYHLDIGEPRVNHAELCATMPAVLVAALTSHAERLLAAAGITGEPLTWHPPTTWTTTTDWPGADADRTDPEPVHHALRAQWAANVHNYNWAPTHAVAATLGISSHHLRHVLRHHPIDHAPYRRQRAGAVIAMTAAHGTPGYRVDQPAGAVKPFYFVDPAWLREQYTTWHRSLPDIATEIGCRRHTLRAFAEAQGIPRRPRGGGRDCIAAGTITGHPGDLPDPLRTALLGPRARSRIERFLIMTEHPSLNQAAVHTGLNQSSLTAQLQILERSCGGPLFQRPHPRAIGPLTPLGEQLCHQARHYLDSTPHT